MDSFEFWRRRTQAGFSADVSTASKRWKAGSRTPGMGIVQKKEEINRKNDSIHIRDITRIV